MAEKTSTTTSKLDLKPVEVGVGAGAAVITAIASSYLGTAGTLTGAALASIVGTVSTSVLRRSAERTNESLMRTTARLRQSMAAPRAAGGSTAVDPGVAAVDETELAAVQPAPEPPTTLSRHPRPRWAVLAAGAVAAFVVALVAITGIESAFGKPLAALVGNEKGGGTTIGRTVGSDRAPPATDTGTPTPTPSATGSSSPEPSTSPPTTGEPSPTGEPSSQPTTAAPTLVPTADVPAPTGAAPTP